MNSDLESPFRRKMVVIVEDDDANAQALVMALALFASENQAHYDIALVNTGQEVLGLAQDIPVDLYLLDYHLPGMNGRQIYEQLCILNASNPVPALFLTDSLFYNIATCTHAHLLQKPYDIDDLFKELTYFLD